MISIWSKTRVRAKRAVYALDGLTNVIYKLTKKSNPDDYPILFRIYGAGSNCCSGLMD